MPEEPIFLYVEDDPQSQMVMESVLTLKLGYSQLTIFESSADFEARLEALPQKPTIIFLDIHMKPYSGFDLLHMLRNSRGYRDTTIIAMTASVMGEEIQQLKTAGFNGVIAKPLDLSTFGTRLARILAGEDVWDVV